MISQENLVGDEATDESSLIATETEAKTKTKIRYYKNLIVFSLSYFFAFGAYNGLSNLQSTLNKEGNVGVIALFIGSFTSLFSCLLLPSLTIKHCGYKLTLVLSQLTISFYVCANFYPKWWTLYPTSALFGLASGPLWTIQGCFITDIAKDYASFTKQSNEAVLSKFFGIFMIILKSRQVFGNLVSSLVLRKASSIPLVNFTNNFTDYSHCGAYDCIDVDVKEEKESQNAVPLDPFAVRIMCIVYLAMSFTGLAIVAIFLDNIKHKAEFKSTKTSLLETISLFKDWKAWSLVPVTSMVCFISVFISTDLTKSFIACLGGINDIGYWFCLFGLVSSVFSFVVGHTAKYLGRILYFIIAFAITAGLHVFILLWKPQTSQYYVVFLFALLYGLADSIWSTQINAMLGVVFHSREQQAFANNRFVTSIMYVVAYAYSAAICVTYQVYIIIASIGLSLVTLVAVEVKVRKSSGNVIDNNANS